MDLLLFPRKSEDFLGKFSVVDFFWLRKFIADVKFLQVRETHHLRWLQRLVRVELIQFAEVDSSRQLMRIWLFDLRSRVSAFGDLVESRQGYFVELVVSFLHNRLVFLEQSTKRSIILQIDPVFHGPVRDCLALQVRLLEVGLVLSQ